MRPLFIIATITATALVACGPSVRVTTMAAPDTRVGQFRTFRVLTPPPRRDGRREPGDPMLVNSISNQALQSNIADAFIARGYILDPIAPSFTVAYYASARERLDLSLWDYGYRGRWGGFRNMDPIPVYYTEGTVVIDVIDAVTNDLVWRGRGTERTTDDPGAYQKSQRDAVAAIVRKFPEARHPARP
jgi:hypothetical protein